MNTVLIDQYTASSTSMSEQAQTLGLMVGPPRNMSTIEIKNAFGQMKSQPRRKRSVGIFDIAEDKPSCSLTMSLSSTIPNVQLHRKRIQTQATSGRIAPSTRLYCINEAESLKHRGEPVAYAQGQLRKDVRRRTIFIPEDTTVMTIHPGHRHEETFASGLTVNHQKSEKTSELFLARVPKRNPLQIDHSAPQVPNVTIDRAGQSTGKENVPPGSISLQAQKKSEQVRSINRQSSRINKLAKAVAIPFTAGSPVIYRKKATRIRPAKSVAALGSFTMREQITRSISSHKSSINRKYPVIDEDIENMVHYEDNWVANQEVLLTEILNRLFDSVKTKIEIPSKDLRESLLKLYEEQEHDCIMRRVKSSLNHGALALPSDESGIQLMASRYLRDIGIRNQFIKLWLDSYRPRLLEVALEVITGRQIPNAGTGDRLALQQFIESCLLLNEDLDDHCGSPLHDRNLHCDARLWRRTMYRSLSLILLLDAAMDTCTISGSLLQATSRFKASQSVLVEVNDLLRGSSVDALRVLRFIGYQVTYTQNLRSEYDYKVQNIAVDFRDGMRLGRLVELIESTTKLLVDGYETPQRSLLGRIWTNTNLRLPATTKAAKKFNIEKVLSYLNKSSYASHITHGVQASEIMDGHREQTVALLWTIVSQFGIGLMVDWDDLRSEIHRLELELQDMVPGDSSTTTLSISVSANTSVYHQTLKRWTTLLANKHGIPISNFSTSFCKTPSPFTAIIKEYLSYMVNSSKQSQEAAQSLKEQFKQIGCGSTFSSLFSRSRIFDQRFVLTTLAFLASRVLTASKQNRTRRFVLKTLAEHSVQVVHARNSIENAAKVIQKVWKCYLLRKKEQAQALQKQQMQENEPEFWLL